MPHDLDDISTRACWTRLNETPEDIARMSMRFMKEFSTQIKLDHWRPLRDEWDGTEEELVTAVKNNAVKTEEGKISRGAGYSITLEAYSQTAWRPVKPLVRTHLRKAVNKPPTQRH